MPRTLLVSDSEASGKPQGAPLHRNPLRRLAEDFLLILVAVVSISLGALRIIGLFQLPIITDQLENITLSVVGLVAGYLVLERRRVFEQLGDTVDRLGESNRQLSASLHQVEREAVRTNAFFDGLVGDRFAELKLLYGIRAHSVAVRDNMINGTADQAYQMWADALQEATSFLAFNYASPDEVWGTKGWALNVAHALQVSRISLGATIKRVFVIDDACEYDKIRNVMKAQETDGIQVRWLLKTEVLAQAQAIGYLKEIGTWDLVLVDTDLLYLVYLDDNRHIKGCSLIRDSNMHSKLLHMFREFFESAHDPSVSPGGLT